MTRGVLLSFHSSGNPDALSAREMGAFDSLPMELRRYCTEYGASARNVKLVYDQRGLTYTLGRLSRMYEPTSECDT